MKPFPWKLARSVDVLHDDVACPCVLARCEFLDSRHEQSAITIAYRRCVMLDVRGVEDRHRVFAIGPEKVSFIAELLHVYVTVVGDRVMRFKDDEDIPGR